jgi:MoaA/NifB/PqqE/SkfB family radical SAM enzyme
MAREVLYVLNSGCSQCCKGCYLESQKQYPNRNYPQALKDVAALNNKGLRIFLTGSDIVRYDGVERLLAASDQAFLLGNIFAIPKEKSALEAIARDTNVKMIMITSPSSTHVRKGDDVNSIIGSSVSAVKNAGLEPVLTFVVGMSNYDMIESFAHEAIRHKVKYARFVRYIPIDEKHRNDFMDDSHMDDFLEQIRKLKATVPKEELYIKVDGLFGTHWRKEKGPTCFAGSEDFLIGLDNRVYPCEFLIRDDFVLGKFENGVIKLERKLIGLSDFDCKAKQILGDGKDYSFVEVDEALQ